MIPFNRAVVITIFGILLGVALAWPMAWLIEAFVR
jgi:hypothetical protein